MTDNSTFKPVSFFTGDSSYRLLPFRFKRIDKDNVLLTNITGEFVFVSADEFKQLTAKKLPKNSETYNTLRARSFLADENSSHIELLSSRLWTKKSFIKGFTKLHIFVLTLRCNCSCTYCQASRQSKDASSQYDMKIETARKAVDTMLQSPSEYITAEFQGGEPLLNFDVIKEIVTYANNKNEKLGKNLNFVVCTNLSLLTEEMLDFFKKYDVSISTSIDGPAHLHDNNRCRKIKSATHSIVEKNIIRCQEALGREKVSALMTTTRESLKYPKEIIDEYLRLGLGSIFIRALNPYGYAIKTQKAIGYTVEEFLDFYKEAFNYIIQINKNGTFFSEAYAALLFRKILTPWTVGFVDLQSPTGNGFAVTVYNYDGDVYASDESRMLYEMGDPKFRLGSVLTDSYEQIYFGKSMQLLASTGVAECLAGCADCAFVPYCGADPVRHYTTQKDAYGNRASSDFCKKNKLIFQYLFEFLRDIGKGEEDIIWSWLQNCPANELMPTWSSDNEK